MESMESEATILKDLKATMDKMMAMMIKKEDDSLLLNSLAGQVQIIGQRLRQMELEVVTIKQQICGNSESGGGDATNVEHLEAKVDRLLQVTCSNKEDIIKASSSNTDQIIKAAVSNKEEIVQNLIENKDKVMKSSSQNKQEIKESVQSSYSDAKGEIIDIVKSTSADQFKNIIDNVNMQALEVKLQVRGDNNDLVVSTGEQCNKIMSEVQNLKDSIFPAVTRLSASVVSLNGQVEQQLDSLVTIEHCSVVLNEKVERITKVTTFLNTKLKTEMSDLKDAYAEMNISLGQKVQRQTEEIRGHAFGLGSVKKDIVEDLKQDLKQKFDTLKDDSNKQQKLLSDLNGDFKVKGKLDQWLSSHSAAVIDQIISESHINRDFVRNNWQQRSIYDCDFHLYNFSECVGTGKYVYSRLWYIDQADSYIKGYARFEKNGNVRIWLVYGCEPRTVGLQSQGKNVNLHCEVTVKHPTDEGQSWTQSVVEWPGFDASNVDPRCDGWINPCGKNMCTLSCKVIKDRGLIKWDKVLVHFKISVK